MHLTTAQIERQGELLRGVLEADRAATALRWLDDFVTDGYDAHTIRALIVAFAAIAGNKF